MDQSPPRFDLSVCIPTYNRRDRLLPLVRRVLSCADPRIEVVVLDNASTDDTLAQLRAIADPRLSVHANEVNRGVLFNVTHVIGKARGRFAVLLLDKDDCDPALLPGFRDFLLSQPGLACGYCEYGPAAARDCEVFEAGMPAVRGIGFAGHHPTGYFFEMARLREIRFLERFNDFDRVGHFCFEFMFSELLVAGRGARYLRPVFAPESLSDAAKVRSHGTNAATEDAFFSPAGRTRTALRFCEHIQTLPLEADCRRELVLDRYVQGMLAATKGYRQVVGTPQLCAHYNIAPRRVGTRELLAIARRFHRSFCDQPAVHALYGPRMARLRFGVRAAARVAAMALARAGRRFGRGEGRR